ncbi:GNAT family N-acetyltransferase [Streptomyces sp. NPDC020472]|uniref:GNAT family N-acetyltransferase n=1 Tax=Streptomyces sp. NPDC020472 TaxID=3365075 RepID=UPI00379393A4
MFLTARGRDSGLEIERNQRPGLVGDLHVGTETGTETETRTGRRRARVGITLAADVRHRGYATEAMAAVADRLFATGVKRIVAACDARNTPSAKLLRRVGFAQRGREKQYLEQRGVHADVLLFRMSAEQLRRPS